MGKIFLVARREYLAYVTAWGFWLGLLFTPLIFTIAAGLPMLIEKTQPARYYTVIDEDGRFAKGLESELSKRRERAAIALIRAASDVTPTAADDPEKLYESFRANGADIEEALQQALPGGVAALPSQSFVYVDPPATAIDGLKPFLTGDALVKGRLGERSLYAAFIVFDDRIEYWSEDVVASDLRLAGQSVSEDLEIEAAFRAAGVSPDLTRQAIDAARPVESRSPSVADETGAVSLSDRLPFYVALVFSGMLWLLIFSVVNYLLTGTIEERSNKIFDSLLTSISLPQLLTGKLLGVLGLSLTLIGVWGSVSGLFALVAGDQLPPELALGLAELLNPGLLIPTLISFALGYLMYGALFLALGSLCDSIQEAQALLSPVFIIMMIPLLMLPVSINSPDSPLLGALSWVPLLTPFLLILRIPNDLPGWMIAVQILWMALFTLGALWAGTRVYRAGAVHGAGLGEVRGWFMRLIRRRKAASPDA